MANSETQGWQEGRWKVWRLVMWGGAGFLLLLPLIANAPWTASDFVMMGALFVIACGTVELAIWASGDLAYRAAAGIAVLASFLLIWINLAVGIIGSENNPANLMYGAVLGIAIVGSIIALGKASRLSWVMYSAAAAQLLVTLVALGAGWGSLEPPGTAGILALNGFFVAMWLLSGWLFGHSASQRSAGAAP